MSDTTPGEPHTCLRHSRYLLTCDEWTALALAAGVRCSCCGQEVTRLVVDHDHDLGQGAVRGLVCARCNNALRRVDAGVVAATPQIASYLEHAWHLQHRPNLQPIQRPFGSVPEAEQDPIGSYEISQLLSVNRQRVHQLASTAGFPPPICEISAGGIWDRNQVIAWARADGRIVDDTED